ncbi:hypothetical protein CC2G_005916 [Coprinopsis cinerea AmutBmut pab1-1]|nr:hypothetical protein CC2G_005916 [Coprinopsis cinerea AmutBmut pab1-1]
MPLDKPNSFLLSIVDESISLPPYLLPLAITDQFPPWLPDRSPEAMFLLSLTAWFDLCRRKNYARGMVIGATNVAKTDTGNATITPTNAPYAARMLPDTTLVPSGVPITDQHLATFHPDQYDALLDDGDYDDYLWGDEGEHNLNTMMTKSPLGSWWIKIPVLVDSRLKPRDFADSTRSLYQE